MSELPRIQAPNFTKTPNVILDDWMPVLSGSEFKIAMAISRQTFGYHRTHDAISISRLQDMTGLSNRAVIDACSKLISLGLIKADKATVDGVNQTTVYSFIFDTEGGSEKSSLPRHEKSSLGGSEKSSHIKETSKDNNKDINTLSDKLTVQVDTEQAQVNDEKVSPPKQPAKPVNVGYELGQVIGELLGIPATCKDIGYALVGSGKRHKSVADMFKVQPVTIDEFRAFYGWFKRKYPTLDLKSPLTIANHIADYRKSTQSSSTHVTTVIDSVNEITFIY